MSGTRGGVARVVAMGLGLAVAVLLLVAGEARGGFYSVAQCGWYVGADADWWDATGGAKFRSDAYCVLPAGADPFAGAHLKSLTRDNQGTVSGNRFARWRWVAPPTTSIRQIRGTWWQALHDGMEQRLGGVTGAGFEPFLAAAATDATPREFANTFTPSVQAVEDRLLCARAEHNWCSLDRGSWSGLRALTLTVDDGVPPGAWITGGDLTDGGWRRGDQFVAVAGYDAGSGVRFGETLLDGARFGATAYPCEQQVIDGEWRATRMQPCLTNVSATHQIATAGFSDGPHTLSHCTADFAGNVACAPQRTVFIDNNPPAHPRSLSVLGGEAWRRVNDFDLGWTNPGQGPASPIGGAFWRITGPSGYDTGPRFVPGRGLAAIADRSVPGPGVYSLHLWLHDEAGNDAPSSAVEVPLRFDDVPPRLAFAGERGEAGERLEVEVADLHSGPAGGAISHRRLDAEAWTELATRLLPGAAGGATLAAAMPELAPGTYVFRAEAMDAAGNAAATTRRADGTEMTVRRTPAPVAPQRAVTPRSPRPPRVKTRLFARLRGGHGRGDSLTVSFGATGAAGAAGALGRLAQRRAALAAHRRGGPPQRPGPRPRGTAATARQAGRDPVPGDGDRALAAGARHPHRPRRSLPCPLPLPLRQRPRLDPAAGHGAG
ncbi:MAG TPA: hypothetical protein VFX85_03805 [Solirubrobacterales bacterium]|nr:hypothetical protein [Solirubrobacterales bacterium]